MTEEQFSIFILKTDEIINIMSWSFGVISAIFGGLVLFTFVMAKGDNNI